MASYASIVENIPEYINPINFDLLGKVMGAKQARFDQNLAQTEQVMSELKLQENLLLRDKDKQAFVSKVQGLVDTVNRSGKIDWSNSGLTRQIKSHISQVVDDPYIMQQIGNSTKIRNFYSQVDELKKKNDGRYSDINFNDAIKMAGVDKYMADEMDEVATPQYQNYVDVTKTTAEKVKQFKDLKGDETIEVRDGQGGITRKEIKGLTSDEIMAYMPSLLSPEEKAQLGINGRYRYSQNPQQALTDLNTLKEKSLTNLSQNITFYDSIINNTNLPLAQREEATQKKNAVLQNKKSLEDGLGSITDANQAASYIEQQNWMTNFATMAGARTSITYDTDKAYQDSAMLELALRKDAREELKLASELAPQSQEIAVSMDRVPDTQVEEADPYNYVVKDFNQSIGNIKSTVNSVIGGNSVDQITKDNYKIALDKYMAEGHPESVAMKKAFETVGLSKTHPEQHALLIKEEVKRNKLGNVIAESDKGYLNTYKNNKEEFLSNVENALSAGGIQETIMTNINNVFKGVYGVAEDSIKYNASKNILRDFVNKNGGMSNLDSVLSKSPEKLKQLNTLLKNFANNSNNFVATIDLDSSSKKDRNAIIAKQGEGIVTTLDVATITDKKVRERIANSIPQLEGQQNFSADSPITIIPQPDGVSFMLRQEGGSKTSASGNEVKQPNKEYIVTKDSDLYKLLGSSLELQAERRGITATNTSYPIKASDISYLEQTNKSTLQRTVNHIKSTVGNSTMASKNPPEFFLTPELTKTTLNRGLAGIVDPQKIDYLVTQISKDPSKYFSVEAVPQQGTWTTKVILKKGETPILIGGGDTYKSKMDDQLLLYVKQYPQILIGEALLNYLKETPQNIDILINRVK